ncbi:melatonin receptor type 1B-like [Octopus vulgaris]|uniref:Melatonin receptor type 1B-like n=1 Tax=Octopus vulgaris TaxID=6645 RepID=A0AA36AYS6_OCTVU|nr:melatonin receptor type 1B-like [Octopus vulgaris]
MIFDLLHDLTTSNMSFFTLDMTSNSVVTVSPLNSTAPVIYRTPLLQTKPILAIIYLIILLTVSSFGMITNPISFIIHYKNQKLNKVGRIFLMNLCLADMCVNYISLPACAIGVIKGEEFFRRRSIYCKFVSSLCFTACVCAILNLSMATINRFISLFIHLKFPRPPFKKLHNSYCIYQEISTSYPPHVPVKPSLIYRYHIQTNIGPRLYDIQFHRFYKLDIIQLRTAKKMINENIPFINTHVPRVTNIFHSIEINLPIPSTKQQNEKFGWCKFYAKRQTV